jgi:hypothetical protein
MPSLSRWTWAGIAAALGIALVIPIAMLDHRRKDDRIAAAPAAAGACAHFGKRCDEDSLDEIEASWGERKRVYKGLVVLFGVTISSALVAGIRRRL